MDLVHGVRFFLDIRRSAVGRIEWDVLESAGDELRVSTFSIMCSLSTPTNLHVTLHKLSHITKIFRTLSNAFQKATFCPCSASNPGNYEVRKAARPIAQLRWIASNSHPLADTGRPIRIQDEQLEPPRRTDMRIRRCCDSAGASGARHRREYCPLTHTISVCT